ncbi:MAG TPA: S8 family serine peptidase, partial [Rhizomicrobium sp.]
QNLAGLGDAPATPHGTAIASLLVGKDGDFTGYLPGAALFAADVFGGQAGGGGALEIARALDWLAANDVAVVNISLTGPDNKLLERAVRGFLARGGIVVAAVGNGGPAAPASYPAAYAGVVGVSSVDQDRHLEIDASRHAATFVALGVDVRAARPERGYGAFTGTSFAAPAVAARFALLLGHPDPAAAQRALLMLQKAALHLNANAAAIGYGYLAPPIVPASD